MIKTISIILLCSTFSTALYCTGSYSGSTTACVTLAGAVIKAQHVDSNKKYRRSECPVCKGKGWYISGDGIAKVECGYCEPDKKAEQENPPHTIIRRK
jgi:DnaJ-class molecular chaperone